MFEQSIGTATHLGEIILILPASLAFVLWMALSGGRRVAVAWLAGLLAASSSIFVLKVVILAYSGALHAFELRSPSGHATLSAFFFPSIGLLYAAHLRRDLRWLPPALGVLAAAFVCWTRVHLGCHTLPEVSVGLAVGLCGFVVFRRFQPAGDAAALPVTAMLAAVVALSFTPGVFPVSFEPEIAHITNWLAGFGVFQAGSHAVLWAGSW